MQFPSIYPVACHTDNVGLGTTFVAINGVKQNGVDYILRALDKGAKTIVVHEDVVLSPEISAAIDVADAKLVRVQNTRKALAELSAENLHYPAKKLKIIGITGTKGKSTSTFLLEHTLRNMGFKTAMLSTVKNKINEVELPTQLTTQLPDYLHVFFNECVKQAIEYVVMEVAAQAFSLYRVWGIEFSAGLFTNFSQEHFEFYASLEEYFTAKAQLVEHLKLDAYLHSNADDSWSEKLKHTNIQKFGIQNGQFRASNIITNLHGISFTVRKDSSSYAVSVPSLVGEFNVYNCLGVLSICNSLGLPLTESIKAVETFTSVPGRMQRVLLPNKSLGVIDYAHNPSSLEAILSTLKQLTNNLIVVFGAGGDRDNTKRSAMGQIASDIADIVIITSDNPRSEDPQLIIKDIASGIQQGNMHKVYVELDREKAIKQAYELSKSTSIIALLGKGPDEYQIIGNTKFYFSESEILRSF